MLSPDFARYSILCLWTQSRDIQSCNGPFANTAEAYVFMYPLFSGDRAKNDQLRVLSKFRVSHQVVIQSIRCMHLVTCRACAQKSGYTSYNSVSLSSVLWTLMQLLSSRFSEVRKCSRKPSPINSPRVYIGYFAVMLHVLILIVSITLFYKFLFSKYIAM